MDLAVSSVSKQIITKLLSWSRNSLIKMCETWKHYQRCTFLPFFLPLFMSQNILLCSQAAHYRFVLSPSLTLTVKNRCSPFVQGLTGSKLHWGRWDWRCVVLPMPGRVLCRHRGDKSLAQEAYVALEASARSNRPYYERQGGSAATGRGSANRLPKPFCSVYLSYPFFYHPLSSF